MGYPDHAEVVGIRDCGGQMTSAEGKERAWAPKRGDQGGFPSSQHSCTGKSSARDVQPPCSPHSLHPKNRLQVLFTGVRGTDFLRTSPFGPSRKFATRKQPQATAKIRCLGDVPERTILVRCLPRAGRGPEPRPAQKVGTYGRGEPVVQPAAARARRRLRL